MKGKMPQRMGASLVEIVLSIGILAVAGTLIIQLFLGASDLSRRSMDINKAVILSQSAIECVKSGSESELSELGFVKNQDFEDIIRYEAFFDKGWEVTSNKGEYYAVIDWTNDSGEMIEGEVSVVSHQPYHVLHVSSALTIIEFKHYTP